MYLKKLFIFLFMLSYSTFAVSASGECSIEAKQNLEKEVQAFIEKVKTEQTTILNNYLKSQNPDSARVLDIIKKYEADFLELPLIYDTNGPTGRRLMGINEKGQWIIAEPSGSFSISPNGNKYSLVSMSAVNNKPVIVTNADEALSKSSGVYEVVGDNKKITLYHENIDVSRDLRGQTESVSVLRVNQNSKEVTYMRTRRNASTGNIESSIDTISLEKFNQRRDPFAKVKKDNSNLNTEKIGYQPQYEYKSDYISPSGKKAKIDPKEMAIITKDASEQMAKAGFPRNAETISKMNTDPIYRENFFRQLGETFQDYNDQSRGGPFNKQYGERGAEVYKKGGDVCQILATGKGVCRETSIGMSAVLADYGYTSTVRTGNTKKKPYDGRHAWIEVILPDGKKAVMNGNWGKDGFYRSAEDYYKETGYVPDSNQTLFKPK